MDKLDIIIEKITAIAECLKRIENRLQTTDNGQQTERVRDAQEIGPDTLIKELCEIGIISRRAYNCLMSVGIETVEDLTRVKKESMFKIRNFGKKSFFNLDNFLYDNGYKWGKENLVRDGFHLCLPKKK